jgi:WS/DGAT/MGAT family acyltransferase
MAHMTPLEMSFFAVESTSRPMHAGSVMLFDPPPDGDVDAFIERIVARFRATAPVSPWNRRPILRLGSFPGWETVDDMELDYHVRRVTLPAPGSLAQLMELTSHLYPALLDRDRPLWEVYVIDGLEKGQTAIFVKAHHSLADGVGGLKMLFGPLSTAPDDDPRPLWAGSRTQPEARSRGARSRGAGGGTANQLARLARVPLTLGRVVPDTVRLAFEGTAPPFQAAKISTTPARISAARSFAALELPLSEIKRIGKAHGATVNDVLLTLADDAMHRYVDEVDGAGAGRMIALMPVSTRKEGDTASNAAGAALVSLGEPSATPVQRLAQIADSTRGVKEGIRRASPLAFQLQTFTMLGAMELREQLPFGRRVVPHVANFTLSNITGAPTTPLYLGRGRLTGLYAVPIVAGSNAANFTLLPYLDSLCIGIGAARNIISHTDRLAEFMRLSFEDLRACTPNTVEFT